MAQYGNFMKAPIIDILRSSRKLPTFPTSSRFLTPSASRFTFRCETLSNYNAMKENKSHLTKDQLPRIEEHHSRLDIQLPRWPRTLHLSYLWLRDHCQCQQCYDHKTFQRVKDVYKIPLNIRPITVVHSGDHLEIEWPDGHHSSYEYKFLWQNTFEGRGHSVDSCTSVPWTKISFPSIQTIAVPLESFEKSEAGKKQLLLSILKYGVGLITQVPTTEESTRKVVEQISPIKRTFFGEMWTFQADLQHADTAYSNQYLGLHTDSTYFSEAIRIQVFHCLKAAAEGGDTLLVDGFCVAKQFRKDYPLGYEFLSKYSVPSQYIGDDQHHRALDVIFKHHPVTRQLIQFRYNIYDRAPLSSIPFEVIPDYYEHLQNLTTIVRNPKNELQIKLQPGTVLFVDNWRVMHGRNKYSGPRIMCGCYLDNSEFLSRARKLGFYVD